MQWDHELHTYFHQFPLRDPTTMRNLLISQLHSSVQWHASLLHGRTQYSIRHWIFFGPKSNTLGSLFRRDFPDDAVMTVEEDDL